MKWKPRPAKFLSRPWEVANVLTPPPVGGEPPVPVEMAPVSLAGVSKREVAEEARSDEVVVPFN